jgi:hypothetical protein
LNFTTAFTAADTNVARVRRLEAKLAQQLAHMELKPFYGVFLDLRKAFDAMDRE